MALSRHGVFGNPDELLLAAVLRAASSPVARRLDATFIVRGGPLPGVAVAGRFDEAEVERVRDFHATLGEVYSAFHYVDYPQAEADVERLAGMLDDRLGAAALDRARFRAVPRGGHIVLGMLSMVLGLRHDQLGDSREAGDLTVYVDDCALSGHRLRQTLDSADTEEVAFALLRAPAELCRAVEMSEARVRACVVAHPLRDVGRDLMGDRYESWVAQWTSRLGGTQYWIGRPEPVCFAWKEPDRSFFNPATGEREDGWRVVPRELCLAGRSDPQACGVVMQPTSVGPIRPHASVFSAEVDGTTVVVAPNDDRILDLDGVAAAVWGGIVRLGSLSAVVAELVSAFEVDEARARADVEVFVAELIEREILVVDGPIHSGGNR